MRYHGDILEDEILCFEFNTRDTDFAPITLAGTPSLAVYKDDGTTQSTAGLTLSVDHDSITGKHMVKVDTSADAFYVTGADYSVVIAAGTVDTISVVGSVVGSFSIENRNTKAAVVSIANNAITAASLNADASTEIATTLLATTIDGIALSEFLLRIGAGSAGRRDISGVGPFVIEVFNMSGTLEFTITANNGGGTIVYAA